MFFYPAQKMTARLLGGTGGPAQRFGQLLFSERFKTAVHGIGKAVSIEK